MILFRPQRREDRSDNDAGTALTSSINPPTSDLSPLSRKTSTVTPASDKYRPIQPTGELGQSISPHQPHRREPTLGRVVEHPAQPRPLPPLTRAAILCGPLMHLSSAIPHHPFGLASDAVVLSSLTPGKCTASALSGVAPAHFHPGGLP
ncbi:hypothetical protein ACFWAY_11195 [Rhodococcus sp. NPDC059968]|uniref:hypothetical protein n=1 Tax=Rhodococcus sp. NPDC059968 TaxID=3347017 RepID=UPI00366C4EAE